MNGLEASLRDLVGNGRSWAHLGQVTAVEDSADYGFLLDVTLQPSGVEVQCRPVWSMGGEQGEGIYTPIAVDDEVLVIVPDGDLNRALAWPGPPSGPNRPPVGWLNDLISLVHSGGMEVRSSETALVQAVVTEDFLVALVTALTEISTLLTGLGLATPITTQLVADLATLYRSAALRTE